MSTTPDSLHIVYKTGDVEYMTVPVDEEFEQEVERKWLLRQAAIEAKSAMTKEKV